MGDVLNVLISIIPVFVGIIWILQLLARIRRRRRASTTEKVPARELASKRGISMRVGRESDELTPKRHGISPKSEQILGFPIEVKKMGPKDSLSPPIEKEKPPEQGQRVVEDRPVRSETSDILVGRKPLDSIRARSPLAQAMLWKTILDRPLALKESDE